LIGAAAIDGTGNANANANVITGFGTDCPVRVLPALTR